MATRTINIPAYYAPGGITAVEVTIRFELVDPEGKRVVGYSDSEGIASVTDVQVRGVSTSIDLPCSADIAPVGTLWKITVFVNRRIYGTHLVGLADGDPIDFADLIF